MRKVALLMAVILVITMPLSVSAAPRALTINPSISFTGTTATCQVTVVGNNTSEHIEVAMKLMHGNSCVISWYADGYGYVHMPRTAAVTKGLTYDLVVAVSVNGVASTPVSVSGTC